MSLFDIAGLIGVAIILAAYALATTGRLDPKRAPSLALNFAGSSLILLSLMRAFNLSAAAVRAMLKQAYRDGARSRGRIVTVTATAATNPNPGFPAYSTAKGAVNSLMLSLARDYKADGIVANAVLLGGVNFPGSEKFRSAEDNAKAVSAAEVADVLTFLASDRGTGINGELLTLSAREID